MGLTAGKDSAKLTIFLPAFVGDAESCGQLRVAPLDGVVGAGAPDPPAPHPPSAPSWRGGIGNVGGCWCCGFGGVCCGAGVGPACVGAAPPGAGPHGSGMGCAASEMSKT